jgi:hypothetical protein
LIVRAALGCALFALGAGCSVQPGLDGIPIVDARLERIDMVQVGMIGSFVSGSAELVVESAGGVIITTPVELSGGSLGAEFLLVKQFDWGVLPPVSARFDLTGFEDPPTADVLFDVYSGSTQGFALVGGYAGHELTSPSDVGLRFEYPTIGFGLMIGPEWVGLSLAEVDAVVDDDAGPDGGP